MHGTNPRFHQYLDALQLLGLRPGAGIDAVRAAWKEKLKDCHPDRFPGDKAKEQRAQALNAAHDLLEEMSKDGDAQTFAAMAERTRRTGGNDSIPTPGPAPLLVVVVVMAPAGAGKTRGWVRSVSRRGVRRPAVLLRSTQLHVIFCAPTIALLDQTAGELDQNGLRAPAVTVIHSNNTKTSVSEAMRDYFDTMRADREAALLCTHVAIFDTPLPPDPKNWDLVFDEMPDTVTFLSLDCPDTHWHLSRFVNATLWSDDVYQLAPQGGEHAMKRLTRIANNRPKDDGLTHLQELARALVHGRAVMAPRAQWDELVAEQDMHERTVYSGHLDMIALVPPTWFLQYRSVTMMGARCLSHFTALVWKKLGVEFHPENLFNLPRGHSREQGRRLTIRWIFEERATRSFLARKSVDGGNLFMATCKAVAAYYDGAPFIWSAPQQGAGKEHAVSDAFWVRRDTEQPDAFKPELRLPGRAHGLNLPRFLNATNVALLSVVNLAPAQYELLHKLELTDDEIDRAMSFDVAYQDMARCNIRLPDSREPVDVTVLDQATALELADKFPGCHVERYPDDLLPAGLARPGRRGPAPSGNAKSNADRQKAYRARQATARTKQEEVERES